MASVGFFFREKDSAETNAMRARLNAIAADHGYVAWRGPTAGQGNAAAMLAAIDSGELATVLLPDEQRDAVIPWLFAQAEQVESFTLSEALKSLAEQLHASRQREAQQNDE